MTEGQMIGAVNGVAARARPTTPARRSACCPPRLTVTFGFGPGLFERRGPRPGRANGRRRCSAIPPLPADELNPSESGGDLCVQACTDDPQVAFHAVRNLARIGRGTVVMRWSQLGFGRTSTHQPQPGHAAQPDGLQGRHRQHPRRGHRGDGPLCLGRRRRPGLDARRQLHGHPPDQDAARDLGPLRAGRPGSRRSAATSTAAPRSAASEELDPLDLEAEQRRRSR